MKSHGPGNRKINYRISTVPAESFGDFLVGILARRLHVRKPVLTRRKANRSGFLAPNLILLSKNLYNTSMELFVANCVHEFAHYMHARKVGKGYNKIRNKHNKDFFNWLCLTSKAAFAKPDGDKMYPWEHEYKYLFNLAVKNKIVKVVNAEKA